MKGDLRAMGSNLIGSTNPLFLFPFEEYREIGCICSRKGHYYIVCSIHILYSEAGASLIDLLLFVFSTEGERSEDMGYCRLIVFTNESTTETLHN